MRQNNLEKQLIRCRAVANLLFVIGLISCFFVDSRNVVFLLILLAIGNLLLAFMIGSIIVSLKEKRTTSSTEEKSVKESDKTEKSHLVDPPVNPTIDLQKEPKKRSHSPIPTINRSGRKMGKVFKLRSEVYVCPGCQVDLYDEQIHLAVFQDQWNKQNMEYVEIQVLSCGSCKKAFVTHEMQLKINRVKRGGFVDVSEFEMGSTLDATKSLVAPKQDVFKWPSTESKTSELSQTLQANFKEQSELNKLGYKITGLTRKQRWFVLEQKAVPQLGLEKVATIIAAHVRNRKRQKNGYEKNKNSIDEWEYDLQKLKQHFYNGRFEWPKTKV